jgi:hypothetical protein
MLEAPENSGELIPFQDHVLLNINGKWRVQMTLKSCNRKACFELLTHPQYSKIHALLRHEKINFKGQKAYFLFDPLTETWTKKDSL